MERTKTVTHKKATVAKRNSYGNVIGNFRNDTKVQKAWRNRVSELALIKALDVKSSVEPHALLNSTFLAPVKNMVKRIPIAGVNLIIAPSLPTFDNDPFIIEKTRRANLTFSNKA